MEELKYPVGKFKFNADEVGAKYSSWIREIQELPQLVRKATNGLNDPQLDQSYRPEGWTLRQVVHHLADSHINAYCRIKLALTEDKPAIKPYNEVAWAGLKDASSLKIEVSLKLLDALHERWTFMNETLSRTDLDRTLFHPESKREMSIAFLLALYAWHGRHHTAHITTTRQRNNW